MNNMLNLIAGQNKIIDIFEYAEEEEKNDSGRRGE